MDANTQKKVLVVGDLMLDRTWITSFRVEQTAQSHSGIEPQKRFNPAAIDYRAGGAGLTALAVAQFRKSEVHLLSAECHPHDRDTFREVGLVRAGDLPEGDLQEGDSQGGPPVSKDEVKWHVLHWVQPCDPVTTVKFRFYSRMAGQLPKLKLRFDQDPPANTKIEQTLPASLPPKFDVVFVSEFNKGAVTKELLRNLHERYRDAIWLLDAKNESLLHEFGRHAGDTKFVILSNRSEAERLSSTLPLAQDEIRQRTILTGKRDVIWLPLLRHGLNCMSGVGWEKLVLVVKLDEDGAVVFWKDAQSQQPMVYAAVGRKFKDVDGVGAGDFFGAGCVHEILLQGDVDPEHLLKGGITCAERWIQFSEQDFWKSEAHRPPGGAVRRECPWPKDLFTEPDGPAPKAIRPQGALQDAIAKSADVSKYPDLLGNPKVLTLSLATGYLGNFLTVDPEKGALLGQFAQEVAEYFARSVITRPLNCFVWAHPGAGKSFFAKEAAGYAGAHFHEINVSQLTSVQELLNQLGYVAAQKHDNLLLLMDEVDTKIQGNHVYPQLLAPLWDGTVASERGLLNLGRRFVCVLVASDKSFDSGDEFVQKLAKSDDEKMPDLASRINGPVLTLGEPSQADRAYMTASLISRIFNNSISEVHFGLLDFIVKGQLTPRKIEQLLGAVKQPRDGQLSRNDWKHLVSSGRGMTGFMGTSLKPEQISECVRSLEFVRIAK